MNIFSATATNSNDGAAACGVVAFNELEQSSDERAENTATAATVDVSSSGGTFFKFVTRNTTYILIETLSFCLWIRSYVRVSPYTHFGTHKSRDMSTVLRTNVIFLLQAKNIM